MTVFDSLGIAHSVKVDVHQDRRRTPGAGPPPRMPPTPASPITPVAGPPAVNKAP